MPDNRPEPTIEPVTPEGVMHPIGNQLDDYYDTLGDGSRAIEGLETGVTSFDELIGGLNRFVLIAGQAGVGKTTLALQLALGIIDKEKIPVIYYSFEMSRRDMLTMAVQNIHRKLTRSDIVLRGRAPQPELIASGKPDPVKDSLAKLKSRYGGLLYILDSHEGVPTTTAIREQIEQIKATHKAKDILVVIDSLQDIVPTGSNQVQSEGQVAQELVQIQHATDATIFAISQRSKEGVKSGDGYGSVKGSVDFMHKPTTVLNMIGGKDALRLAKERKTIEGSDYERMRDQLNNQAKDPSVPYPVLLTVLKGRNSGYGKVPMQYYGAYRYYDEGRSALFAPLYDTFDKLDN